MDALQPLLSERAFLLLLAMPFGLLSPYARTLLGIHAFSHRLARLWLHLARKLDRTHRPIATRLVRGLVLMTLWLMASLLCAGIVLLVLAISPPVAQEIILIAILACAMDTGRLIHLTRLSQRLKSSPLPLSANQSLTALSGFSVLSLDSFGARRLSIEATADIALVRLSGVAGAYLLGGLPLLFALLALTLAVRTQLAHIPSSSPFCWAERSLWRLVRGVMAFPFCLSLPLAACVVPQCSPLRALKGLFSAPNQAIGFILPPSYLNGIAYATRTGLAGPLVTQSHTIARPWLGGDASAKLDSADHTRALWLIAANTFIVWLAAGIALSYVLSA